MSTIMLVLVEPCAEYDPYLHSTYLILQRAAAIIGYQSLSFLRKSMHRRHPSDINLWRTYLHSSAHLNACKGGIEPCATSEFIISHLSKWRYSKKTSKLMSTSAS